MSAGWEELDQGLFSISVAAELAGLHPQTLRLYEREGLLDPARSAGGTRRYSRNDIARLHQISGLADTGLNMAGIRQVLALQEENRQLQAEITRLRRRLGPALPRPAVLVPGRAWQPAAAPVVLHRVPGNGLENMRAEGPGHQERCRTEHHRGESARHGQEDSRR